MVLAGLDSGGHGHAHNFHVCVSLSQKDVYNAVDCLRGINKINTLFSRTEYSRAPFLVFASDTN